MTSEKHMEKARQVVGVEGEKTSGYQARFDLDYLVRIVATSLASAEREGMKRGYELGFAASGEGWNGEYPFGDQNRSPTSSLEWVVARDHTLSQAGKS